MYSIWLCVRAFFFSPEMKDETHTRYTALLLLTTFDMAVKRFGMEQKENTPWIPPLTRLAPFGERMWGELKDGDRFTYSDFLLLIPELLFVARDNFFSFGFYGICIYSR